MFPVYLIVGLINIFAQRDNYGIKDPPPNGMDIRVRRSLPDAGFEPITHTAYENQLLDRPKRNPYYRKIRIPVNPRSNSSNTTNRYDIFNPNYNYLFNRTNVTNSGTGYNNRPYKLRPATSGYRNPGSTPVYYNYQNPNGQSFAGYNSYTPRPVNYSPLLDMLANYPRNNAQNLNVRGSSSYNNNNLPTPMNNNNYNMPTTLPTPSNDPYGMIPTSNNTNPYGALPNNNLPTAFNNNLPTAFNNNLPTAFNNNLPTAVSPTNSPVVHVTTPSHNTSRTTTERILSGCVICNIPCPEFMKRIGIWCVDDEDYS